jgi:hypothetical protein
MSTSTKDVSFSFVRWGKEFPFCFETISAGAFNVYDFTKDLFFSFFPVRWGKGKISFCLRPLVLVRC